MMSSLVRALHECTVLVGTCKGLRRKLERIPLSSKWKRINHLPWPLMRSFIYNQVMSQNIMCGYNCFLSSKISHSLPFPRDSLVQVWMCLAIEIFMGFFLIARTKLIPSRWWLHVLIGPSSKAQKISSVHNHQDWLLFEDNDSSLYFELPLSSCSLISHFVLTYPSLFSSSISRCNSPTLFGRYCESHLDPW